MTDVKKISKQLDKMINLANELEVEMAKAGFGQSMGYVSAAKSALVDAQDSISDELALKEAEAAATRLKERAAAARLKEIDAVECDITPREIAEVGAFDSPTESN